MSRLFHIEDNLTGKISFYHIVLLMASLPFNMFYSHLILVSLVLHTLIHLNKNNIKPIFRLRTFVLQSVFYITVLSTVYTINPKGAFSQWGEQISIFLFPLLFCLNPFDLKKYRPLLLMAFSMVCTATIVYLYFNALITTMHYRLPFSMLFSPAFTNHNFSEPIAMHATFFSMQVVIALVYLLSVLIGERSFYKKLCYFICTAVLAAGLVQLSSKSIFFVLVIVINIAVPYFLLARARRLKFTLVTAAVTILITIIIANSGAFKERYVTALGADLTKPSAGETTDSRLARWDVAMGLIGKSPLAGYGAGSEIGLLQTAFFTNKLYDSYLNRLNVHSEYLSFLLKSGVIGLLAYIVTLAFGFTVSLREKDLLFFTFMMLIAVVSVSENLLDVDKGVIFYAFFFSFFVFSDEGQAAQPNFPSSFLRNCRQS